MGTNKSRIFIPKNSENLVFYSATIVNLDGEAGQFAFRMNLENGKTFEKLEYSLELGGWVDINNRERSANLYTINIPEGSTRLILRIRVSTNYDPRIIRYFNLQPSPNIEVMDAMTLESIPGMFAHYEANNVLLNDDGNVQFMFDKSGNNNRMEQSQPNLSPGYVAEDTDFNNHPSVSFNGTDQRMEIYQFENNGVKEPGFKALQPQPNTYVMVFKDANLNRGIMFDGVTANQRNAVGIVSPDGQLKLFQMRGWVGEQNISGPLATTDTHLGIFRFDNTDSDGYIDGSTPVFEGGYPNGSPMDGITLGSDYSRNNYKEVKIAEFIMWNRRLDNVEVNFIGNILSEKYGTDWTDMDVT